MLGLKKIKKYFYFFKMFDKGTYKELSGEYPKALNAYFFALSLFNSSIPVYKAIVRTYTKNKAFYNSIDYATKAIGVCGDDDELYALRAEAFRCLKEYSAAIENLQNAFGINSSKLEYYTRCAQLNFYIDDLKSAIENYTSALAQDYKNDFLYSQRGFCKFLQKLYKSAKEDYLSAIKYNPDKPLYYYMLGCIEELNDEKEESEKYFQIYKKLTA